MVSWFYCFIVSLFTVTHPFLRSSYANGGAQFILLVEKDAAFMRLAEDRFYNKSADSSKTFCHLA
jgi:hypothetical protein